MADVDESSFSLMSLEDELTCSICLSPFDCPVTIPCGHNFCQDCLLATWKDSYSCPQCETHFATKPELKKNTVLSSVVQTFILRSNKSESLFREERQEEKDVIRCDTCMEAEASQTCLTCMASFCEEHLRPHRENPNFSVHQLSEPVGDLLERICPDHHKLMELFCSEHGRPICSLCLQQVHKGCSFVSPEEQRNLKEYELRDKLGLLDVKIEKTETIVYHMNETQSKLKDGASKRKAVLAAVYQQMRDMLAQEERKAQMELDCEVEAAQSKLRDLMKRYADNTETMRTAREDINSLLSQSQTSAFLQASFDLPQVVKFEPHMPRITLDSKKVIATQAFANAMKEHLTEILKQPVEDRLPIIKSYECPDEKAVAVSEPASTSSGPEPEPERQEPPEQNIQPISHNPGHPPIQPYFQPFPVPVFSYMGSQPGWNPRRPSPGFRGTPSFNSAHKTNPQKSQGAGKTEKKTVCKPVHKVLPSKTGDKPTSAAKKSESSHQTHHKQDKKQPSAPNGKKPGATGSNFTKKDKPKSHPPSQKSTGHNPRPKKN